jgi:hypothetical protein
MAKANGPLLVVTTCFPVLKAVVMCDRAGSAVLMFTGVTSTTTSASTEAITSKALVFLDCQNLGLQRLGSLVA